jgi:hypothetical protein
MRVQVELSDRHGWDKAQGLPSLTARQVPQAWQGAGVIETERVIFELRNPPELEREPVHVRSLIQFWISRNIKRMFEMVGQRWPSPN